VNLDWLPSPSENKSAGALLYAGHGWNVFPCRGKQPYTSHGLKDATSDPEEVARMWRQWPDANVGWPVREGWIALDVDPRHDGDKSLRELQREHGPLPMTLRAITGSGGEHWIFRVPSGVELRQLAGIRPGLDTRLGGRGYLLVSPSVHPDTGKAYRWLAAVEPVGLPAWLVDMLKAPPRVALVPYSPPPAWWLANSGRERKARKALAGMARLMAEAAEGGRNDLLNWCWFKMHEYRDVVSPSDIAAELRAAALASGLSEAEIAKVLR
jgi:hypothetical protein